MRVYRIGNESVFYAAGVKWLRACRIGAIVAVTVALVVGFTGITGTPEIKTDLQVMELAVGGAYRLDDKWSFGAAWRITKAANAGMTREDDVFEGSPVPSAATVYMAAPPGRRAEKTIRSPPGDQAMS